MICGFCFLVIFFSFFSFSLPPPPHSHSLFFISFLLFVCPSVSFLVLYFFRLTHLQRAHTHTHTPSDGGN